MNVVKCPWCAAEVDLGPTGEDLSDTRYKLTCPLLHVHLAAGGDVTDLECPHMGPAKGVVVLQSSTTRVDCQNTANRVSMNRRS
jgi:hypothetical protein